MGVFGTEKVSKCMLQSFARAMASVIKDKRLFFERAKLGEGHDHGDLSYGIRFPAQHTQRPGFICKGE